MGAVLLLRHAGAVASAGRRRATAAALAGYPVTVAVPVSPPQRLAQRTVLVIAVRNTGSRTIPNIAVTITNPRWGTAASRSRR